MFSSSSSCSDLSMFSDDKKTSKTVKLKQENKKLLLMNEDLSSKLRVLREQFDDALKINSNLEDTFGKHNDTFKELISVREEKENLEERLRMSLQTNDDLSFRLQAMSNDNSTADALRSINGLKKQIKDKDDAIKEFKTIVSHKDKEIIDIVKAASTFFSTYFESAESLLIYLKKPPTLANNIQQSQDNARSQSPLNQVPQQQSFIPNGSMVSQASYAPQATPTTTIPQVIPTPVVPQISQTPSVPQIIQTPSGPQIIQTPAGLSQLPPNLYQPQYVYLPPKEKAKKKKSKHVIQDNNKGVSKGNEKTNESIKEIFDPQISELNKEISTLKRHNSVLNDQIMEFSESQGRSRQPSRRLSADTLENIPMSPSSRRNFYDDERNSYAQKVDDATSQISSLRDERDKMMSLLDRQNELTHSLETKLKKNKEESEELKEKNRKLTKDLKKAAKTKEETEPVMPETVFTCPEFPLDLERMVSGISKNPTLQLSTKIRHIISVITTFFKTRNEQVEKEYKEAKDKADKMKKQTDSLIEFLHKTLPCQNVNFNAILDDETARDALRESVSRLRNELRAVQQDKEMLEQQQEDLLRRANTNSFQDAASSIVNLKSEHKEYKKFKKESKIKDDQFNQKLAEAENQKTLLLNKIKKLKNKFAADKTNYENEIKTHHEAHAQEIQKIIAENQEEINKLKANHEDRMKNFENLQEQKTRQFKEQSKNSIEVAKVEHSKEIDALNNKMLKDIEANTFKWQKEIENKNIIIAQKDKEIEAEKKSIAIIQKELESHKQKAKNQKQQVINKNSEIEGLKQNHESQIVELNNQKEALSKEIEQCKYVIKHLKIRKEKREKEIEFLKKQNIDDEKDVKEKMKTHKDELQNRIDQLSQLRANDAKEYTQSIADLKIQNNELVKEKENLVSRNTNLNLSIQKLETKINALTADRERERKEFESRFKSQITASQTELNTKINDIKVQYETKKHDIYQNILRQLLPIADRNEKYDESNIDGIISSIKRKVESIQAREARIRTLLALNQFESIEEALATKFFSTRKKRCIRVG